MYNDDTDVLFPPRLISQLQELRGDRWRELSLQAAQAEPQAVVRLAFVLMMVRLGGCVNCSIDSFRAMRGCTQCAIQTVKRFRGAELDLIKEFEIAQQDVIRYQRKQESQV